MAATVVTVAELHALRDRWDALSSVTAGLRRLGHRIPTELTDELESLSSASVDVVIRCLLCGTFGTHPAAVDGGGTPRPAICGQCDDDVFQDAGDESGA
jgi:hypothetical protein